MEILNKLISTAKKVTDKATAFSKKAAELNKKTSNQLQEQAVDSVKALQEKPKLSTAELLRIFKNESKEKIDRIIAQHGYPSLKSIENQLKDTPAGEFREDPEGVTGKIDGMNNQILLTFDICSHYQPKEEKHVLNFIDNVVSKSPPVPIVLFVTGNALSNPTIRTALEKASRQSHISIQNHGYSHSPLSTAPGRKIYGIKGTSSIEEAYYEVAKGALLTQSITGEKPKFYRSSTLYADPRGVKLVQMLGFQTLGRTNTDGDRQKLGTEKPGDIVLRHAKFPTSINFIENMRERIKRNELNPVV